MTMGFFKDPDPENIDKWVCIMERGTEYEIAMAKNFLANLEIPSNILSKRDSSYNLNIGDTSMVYLYVPLEFEAEARKALADLENIPAAEGMSVDDPDDAEPNNLTPQKDPSEEENRKHPPHRPSPDEENREET